MKIVAQCIKIKMLPILFKAVRDSKRWSKFSKNEQNFK